MIKRYSELITLPTWDERFEYLYLGDHRVGDMTFGGHRYLNQSFYSSPEWKKIRRDIIVRDFGCDMGLEDYPIPNHTKILIHHINPLSIKDIREMNEKMFDPENLISVSYKTHQMIHYGMTIENRQAFKLTGDRSEGDTKLW